MYYLQKLFLTFLLSVKNLGAKFTKKQSKANENSFKGTSFKTTINNAASLEFSSKVEDLKAEVEKISLKIVKKYFGDADKTLKILEKKGVRVYKIHFAGKILKYINEKQGFLTPLRGFKGFYINFIVSLICDKKLVFNTKSNGMFVFSAKSIDTYFLASQVYRFVAFRKKMPGFEYEVQEKFKKIYKTPNEKNFSKLTAGDIFALKEAIARDVESVDFAMKLHQENELIDKLSNLKEEIKNNN